MQIDEAGCGFWMCEKLGDVDVAVNQGSVDPKTMTVKCSNECGRLSGIDIRKLQKECGASRRRRVSSIPILIQRQSSPN